MRAPQVSLMKNFEELAWVVAHPQEFAERIRQLKAEQDLLNAKLQQASTLEQADGHLADAQSKLDEAKEFHRLAKEGLTTARAEAAGIVAEAQQAVIAQRTEIDRATEVVHQREQAAQSALSRATDLQRDAESARYVAEKAQVEARDATAQATRLQAEISRRLAAMKELVS